MPLVREVPLRDRHVSVGRVLVALLVAMTVSGFYVADRLVDAGVSKIEIAEDTVSLLARDAYALWRRNHPQRVCPPDLHAVASLVGRDIRDPYGEAYQMTCNRFGFFVSSSGEDAMFDTADDIWSGTPFGCAFALSNRRSCR